MSDTLASAFPATEEILADRAVAGANRELMKDLKSNAERKTIDTSAGDKISYDEYSVSKSKILLDRIDLILAAHFGFSSTEADAIFNYDIRFRMGGEENTEE